MSPDGWLNKHDIKGASVSAPLNVENAIRGLSILQARAIGMIPEKGILKYKRPKCCQNCKEMEIDEMQEIKKSMTKAYRDKFGILIDVSDYQDYLDKYSKDFPEGFKGAAIPFDDNFGLNSIHTRHDGFIVSINIQTNNAAQVLIKSKYGRMINFDYKNISRILVEKTSKFNPSDDTIIFDEIRKSINNGLWIHHYETFGSTIIIECDDAVIAFHDDS